MKKIIIAIDSFKGCLTSAEAGKAAENYPELKKAYDLAMELTDIYNAGSIKDAARN